jgi:hypothetical protein
VRDRQALVWLCAGFLCLSLFLIRVHSPRVFFIGEGDDESYFAYARTVLVDRDLNFSNEPLQTLRGPNASMQAARYSIGPGLAWIPFLAIGRLVPSQTSNQVSLAEWIAACLGTICLGLGSVLALFFLLRRFFSVDTAFWAVVCVWLSSPLLYYLFRRPLMSHGAEFFFLSAACALVAFVRHDSPRWHFVLIGACLGWLFLSRWMDAPYVAALGLLTAFIVVRTPGKPLGRLAFLATSAGLAAAAQFLIWRHLTGHWYPGVVMFDLPAVRSSVVFSVFPWTWRHLRDLFIGSGWGIIWLSPVLWLAIPGLFLPASHQRLRYLRVALALSAVLTFWVAANWPSHGGEFGSRYLIPCWALFTLGFALLLDRLVEHPRLRLTAIAIGLTSAVVSVAFVSLFKSNATTLTLHVGPTAYGLPSDWVNETFAKEAWRSLFNPGLVASSFAPSLGGYLFFSLVAGWDPVATHLQPLAEYFQQHGTPSLGSLLFIVCGLLSIGAGCFMAALAIQKRLAQDVLDGF